MEGGPPPANAMQYNKFEASKNVYSQLNETAMDCQRIPATLGSEIRGIVDWSQRWTVTTHWQSATSLSALRTVAQRRRTTMAVSL